MREKPNEHDSTDGVSLEEKHSENGNPKEPRRHVPSMSSCAELPRYEATRVGAGRYPNAA
jgi:hypothetical protein